MKCKNCKEEATKGVRCPSCAEKHRIKVRTKYYESRYGGFPENTDITKGHRPPIRDRILNLLSDGKPRTSLEIKEALKWNSSTSITKTLGDIKNLLDKNDDSRKIEKERLGTSHRLGTRWRLKTA